MSPVATESTPVVLVVDDDRRLVDLYVEGLSDDYTVRTAYDGEEALGKFDDEVDVILLDRRMPGLSGDEVLESIRDRGYDCRVVMVTAVDADIDILDMEFDGYITKPVTIEELQDTVSKTVSAVGDDDALREYHRLLMKKYTLESEMGFSELQEHPEYTELLDDVAELRDRLDPEMVKRKKAEASAVAFTSRDTSQEPTTDFDRTAVDAEPTTTTPTTTGEPADPGADERMADGYESLREEAPLYDALFDNLRDPVIVVDDEWSVIDTNVAFERRFGFDGDEIVGERFSDLFAESDEMDALVAEGRPKLGDPDSFVTLEYRTQDGESLYCETHAFRFDEVAGSTQVYGFVLREAPETGTTGEGFEYGPD